MTDKQDIVVAVIFLLSMIAGFTFGFVTFVVALGTPIN